MRPLLFKAKLAVCALAVVGIGIAVSTNAAKGVSLHAIAGLDTVFNTCYTSYTRSFNDIGRVGGGSNTDTDLIRAFLYGDRQMRDKSTFGGYFSIGTLSFGHAGQVVVFSFG